LERGRGAQRGVKGQVGDASLAGNAGADVTAAFALGLGLGATTGAVAGQAVKLRVQAARLELLPAARLLPPFPPVAFLRRLRN